MAEIIDIVTSKAKIKERKKKKRKIGVLGGKKDKEPRDRIELVDEFLEEIVPRLEAMREDTPEAEHMGALVVTSTREEAAVGIHRMSSMEIAQAVLSIFKGHPEVAVLLEALIKMEDIGVETFHKKPK